jgi:hypothetical protein
MAYERYCAALMHPGSAEERVANAIMSLEAILLSEHLELAYKLRVRTAKLLSFLGENAVDVRNTLNDGYRVRSIFAHGARMSANDITRLTSRYRTVEAFVSKILDFARKAILVSALVTVPKDDLIDLIDDALIEKSAEDRLRLQISIVANVV